MAKRRTVHLPPDSFPTAASKQSASASVSDLPPGDQLPSKRQRVIASIVVIAHFLALLITLSANLAPSYLQGQLTRLLAPYLVTTNQAYNAFPLELTHAEPFDFPVYVELRADDATSDGWEKLNLPGVSTPTSSLAEWRFSRWTNFSRVVRLIFTEQPDNEILSDITAHLAKVAEQQTGESYREIRWVAPKVPSYDEDARMASGEVNQMDDAFSPTIVYSATILHGPAGDLSLVPQQAPLRTAKPIAAGELRP